MSHRESSNKPPLAPQGFEEQESTTVLNKIETLPVISPGDQHAAGNGGQDDLPPQMGQAMAALEEKRKKRRKSRMIKVGIVAGILVVIGLIVGISIISQMLSNQRANNAPTQEVTRGEFLREISSSGSLAPFESQTISVDVPAGKVTSVKVASGDTVEEGQELFTVDSPEAERAVKQAELGLKQAKQGLGQAQQQYNAAVEAKSQGAKAARDARNKAAREHNKLVDQYNAALRAGQDVSGMTVPDFDESQFAFDAVSADQAIEAAKQGIESAQLGVETAQETYNEAKEALDGLVIKAPIAGQVLSSNVEVGTNLATLAQQGKAPMQIANVSQMTVDMQVNEIDVLGIEEGVEARITFDAIPDLTATGTVKSVSAVPAGSEGGADLSRAFGGGGGGNSGGGIVHYVVRVVIDNPDPRLKIGMSARCTLTLDKRENVLMVPLVAPYDDGNGQMMVDRVTYDERGLEQREPVPVKVITQNSSTTVVEGDLHEGDLVALPSGS